MAEYVTARIEAEPTDQAEIVRRSGLSDAFVRSIMQGKPRGEPRAANLRRLAAALDWTPDSIGRIRDGGEPAEAGRPAPVDLAPLVAELRTALLEARQRDDLIRQMVSVTDEVGSRIAEMMELVQQIADYVERRDAALQQGGGAPL